MPLDASYASAGALAKPVSKTSTKINEESQQQPQRQCLLCTPKQHETPACRAFRLKCFALVTLQLVFVFAIKARWEVQRSIRKTSERATTEVFDGIWSTYWNQFRENKGTTCNSHGFSVCHLAWVAKTGCWKRLRCWSTTFGPGKRSWTMGSSLMWAERCGPLWAIFFLRRLRRLSVCG